MIFSKHKRRICAMIALSVVVCIASAVLLAACNDASATALPTDSTAWTFDSLVVTENGQSVTYSVALSEQRYAETGEYIRFDGLAEDGGEGMDVTADMVTVWFSSGAVVMDFADGSEVYGEWRKSGESLGTGTSMIAYDFAGYSTAYGTCGRTEAADGTRTLSLYVVYGDITFHFTAPA